jgi:4-hydroxy-tetrahydrodipicolinate synthase
VIAGRKSVFMNYRPHGARAYLNGISMLDARIGEAFWKAYDGDDQATINFILDRLEAPFFDECAAKYGWHRVNKALLQAAGLMHRRDRMPMPHLSDAEYVTVENTHRKVAAAFQEFLAR